MIIFATRFYLTLRIIDGSRWGCEARVQPAQDNYIFLDIMDDMWGQMLAEHHPQKIKKLSVGFTGLYKYHEITSDLFEKPTRQSERNEKLSTIVDAINKKFGAESIRLGPSPKTRSGHVGTKIVFSRVPDLAEFSE